MKKETRKLIAGTLLCTMAFSAVPTWTFGNVNVAQAQTVDKKTKDSVFSVSQVVVSYPYTFPMGQHLEEGIDLEDCTFETSDSSVAIVNEAGLVIPLSNGDVEITVTTKDGKKDSCPLRVVDNDNVAFTLQDGYKKQGTITGPIPSGFRNEKLHKSSVLRISSTINEGYQVTSIAAEAFEDVDYLEKVVLPESNINVGSRAFANCKKLKTVIVPDKDTSFEEDVFDGDEIVLKGYKGSEAEKYAKEYDNITFEILDTKKDDYAPYEEAIYFSKDNLLVEESLSVSTGKEENLYPAVASLQYEEKDIIYTSGDNKIASVKDGVITGKKAGTTKVTASLPNGTEKVMEVTVKEDDPSLEEKTVETKKTSHKETKDVIFEVSQVVVGYSYPFPMGDHLIDGVDVKDCTFETSDAAVAIVNEAGLVIPLSNGEVEITVTTKDGKKDSCPLRVVDNDNVAFTLQDGDKKQGTITGPIPNGGRNEKLRKSSVLRISSTINEGYQVTSIAAEAFEDVDYLEKVVLPESNIKVESRAFANCKNLKTVIVPDKDTSFEEDVFDGDEIVLKGYKGSEAEEYAKEYDNITFEILDTKKDDYAPYEEAIYFAKDNLLVEEGLLVSAGKDQNLYPAVASLNYGVGDITYTSEDSTIVSVKDGVITGKKAGTTKVTASLPNGTEKVVEVTVEGNAASKEETTVETKGLPQKEEKAAEVASQPEMQIQQQSVYALEQYVETPEIKITAKKASVKVGKSYQFKAIASNTEEELQWTVSNKKVASINKATGKLKAKKAGKVTVKVTCGDVQKKVKVTIKK